MARVDVRSIRRDQILEAAEHLVAQRGWAQTSFAEICREAGVSNGVLTYHFKDKEDLLLALYERTSCTWKEHFSTECSGEVGEGINPFLHLVREAAAAVEEDPRVFLLLLHYLSEGQDHSDVRERIQGMFAEMRAKVGAEIAAAWEAQGLTGDAEVAAGVLQSAMAGFLIMRAALGIKVPPEEMARMMNLFVQSPPICPSATGATGRAHVTTGPPETSS